MLSLLVTSGLVVLIEQPYFNNLLKRVVKSPVCIFWIQGCANTSRNGTMSRLLKQSDERGVLWYWVVSEDI
jgi:hypothetical protein